MFLVRVGWYFVRLALYRSFGLLRFMGRPGSRLIVPVAVAGLAIFARPLWHDAITGQLRAADPGYYPETGVLDVVLFVLVAVFAVAYVIASKILGFALGAFPLATRPLWPQRGLKATKPQAITGVPVRLAVPPLPKQRP